MTTDTNLKAADADSAWQDDIRAGVRHVRDLALLPLSPTERVAAQEAAVRHKVRAPKTYLDLIDWNDPADPIRAQIIPSPDELVETEGELDDPIADHTFSPVPRLTHRHADRVLLFPTYQCAVYCRFCFRKESLTSIGRGYTREALEEAFAYIEARTEIREVILTGGDPLSLPDKALAEIRARIEAIAHVRLLRIHTRVPVVLPTRITPGLVGALQGRLMVTVVTHFNHAREITSDTEVACRTLRQAGFVLLNQSVLLKGVNDTVEVLEELCRELMYRLGVKPITCTTATSRAAWRTGAPPLPRDRRWPARCAPVCPASAIRSMCWTCRKAAARCRLGRAISRRGKGTTGAFAARMAR